MHLNVALGFRVHSGWAAVVALAGPASAPAVLERTRIELADAANSGPFQPYHTAAAMRLADAEAFLEQCSADVLVRACSSLGEVLVTIREREYSVCGCGILFGSGRRPGTLAEMLSSHAMIHTAEGEFFRHAIVGASEHHGVPVTRVTERNLWAVAEKGINLPVQKLQQQLAALGKAIGPPWRQDEKYASVAAWIVLTGAGLTTCRQPVRS